ncbi:glycosyltransferase family 2 protein [Bifidobacterium pullorum]|nr:glycosyltransferase family A protein [Bifidobacterium pullorum]
MKNMNLGSSSADRVSVIVPVYNCEEPLLRRCLDSVLNQVYRSVELIVVDDGSTNGTSLVVDEYADRDERVIAMHQENGGVSSARNRGLSLASGGWTLFVDADDWLEKDAILDGVNSLSQHNADLYIMGHREDKTNGAIRRCAEGAIVSSSDRNAIARLDRQLRLFSCWGKIYRTAGLRGCQFDTSMSWGEDTAFVYNVLEHSDVSVVASEEVSYHYDTSAGGASTSFSMNHADDLLSLDNTILNYYKGSDSCVMKQVYKQMANHLVLMIRTVKCDGVSDADKISFIDKIVNSPLRKYYLKEIRESWASRLEKMLIIANSSLLWRALY